MRTTATLLTVLLLAACSSGSDDDASEVPADTTAETGDDLSATDADADAEEPSAEPGDEGDDVDDSDEPNDSDDAGGDAVDDTAATADDDPNEPVTTTTAPDDESSPTTTDIDTDNEPNDSPTPATTTAADPTPTPTAPPPTTTTPPSPPGLDAAGARQAFDAAVGDFGAADGFLDLPDCPLDPTGELVPATFAGNGEAAVIAAVDSPPENGIFDIGGGFGPMLTCDRFSDDDADSVGLFSFLPPDDGLEAYAEWFANPDGDDGITITVEQTGTMEGGTIHRVCGLDEFSDDFDFCEIDWVTDEIVIGVYVSGPVANTADLDALENGFSDQLEAIIAAFTS